MVEKQLLTIRYYSCSLDLCTPILLSRPIMNFKGKKTPSRRYAMQPIVNMSEEDRVTDTGSMHKKIW